MVIVSSRKRCETRQQRTIQELINLYAAESLAIQSLDFTVLSEAAAVSVPPRETIETFLQTKPICPC